MDKTAKGCKTECQKHYIHTLTYIHTLQYYSVLIRRNHTMCNYMDGLEGIMLSEIGQTQEDKCCLI